MNMYIVCSLVSHFFGTVTKWGKKLSNAKASKENLSLEYVLPSERTLTHLESSHQESMINKAASF